MATGSAPAQVIFLAASATAIAHPISGSACTYLALQSTVKAMALSVPFIFTIAASAGWLVDIFATPTMESY